VFQSERGLLFASPSANDITEGKCGMQTPWESYPAFATASLAMAQTASSVKEITDLVDVTQFWVRLDERTNQEMSAAAQSG
jgi:hypothetical protein